MNWLWFLAGYGLAAWVAYAQHREEDLDRIERYANYVTEDDK